MEQDPAARWSPAADLRPWVDNYLQHPQEQLDLIKASIRRNGWGSPCVALEAGRLVIGHGRLAAYLQLVAEEEPFTELRKLDQNEADLLVQGLVPVRFRDLPEDRAAELALADNESARHGVIDDDRLSLVVQRLASDATTPIDVRALGMLEVDVSDLLRSAGVRNDPASVPAPPIPPPSSGEAVSQFGEVYELGPHRLICGDSHEPDTQAQIAQIGRATVAITDPPFAIYGSSTGLSSSVADDAMVVPFFRAAWRALEGALQTWAHAYVFCDWRSFPALYGAMRGTCFEPCNMLVWDKEHPGLGSKWQNAHELIVFAELAPPQGTMRGSTVGARMVKGRGNVLRCPKVHHTRKHHNAAKPVALIEQLIDAGCDKGDLVLDLFGGGGTTLIAAARTERRALLVEKSPATCDVIRRRWHAWATEAHQDPGSGGLT